MQMSVSEKFNLTNFEQVFLKLTNHIQVVLRYFVTQSPDNLFCTKQTDTTLRQHP